MGGMMSWLADAVRAGADARHLRSAYGAGAESWCEAALSALPPGDPRRQSVRMIAKALQHIRVPTRRCDHGATIGRLGRADLRPAAAASYVRVARASSGKDSGCGEQGGVRASTPEETSELGC
jgi:hypothetical protein